MTANATNPRITIGAAVPEGTYDGIWGGYVVRFSIDGQSIEATTDLGIRTTAAPCVVRMQGGKLTVEAK